MRIAAIAGATILACLMAAAQAQVYCWTTKDGKRQCGDTPPPGVKATAMSAPAASPAASPAPAPTGAKGATSKDAKKGPLTPAQQEQDFRKRQLEAQKTREKDDQASKDADAKKQNCEQARESLRMLESGQRIARVDNQGERYYLDEAQVEQETARARQAVQKSCN